MIDFPASPTVGQVFAGFVYSGTKWQRPKALTETALPRNYVINPGMAVSQENPGVVMATSGTFPVDQWRYAYAGTTAAMRGYQNVGGGLETFLQLYVSGAVDATVDPGDWAQIYQTFEGSRMADLRWGTANAVPVVVLIRASCYGSGVNNLTIGVTLGNAGATLTCIRNLTIDRNFTNYSLVFPGCTTGTWATDNTAWGAIHIASIAGSTYLGASEGTWLSGNYLGVAGMTNGGAVASGGLRVAFVGIYADPYNTGIAPPFVVPDYAQELRRCQRYWYKGFGWSSSAGSATVAGRMAMRHQVPMRATPTGSVIGAPKLYDSSVTPTVTSLATACNSYAAEFDVTASAGGMTPGRAVQMFYNSDLDYIAMNARL